MKKKILAVVIMTMLSFTCVACGDGGVKTDVTVDTGNTKVDTGDTDVEVDAGDIEADKNIFDMLSGYKFEFCSGAGAWSTDLCVEADGSFHGLYHDSDMGDAGDDYPDGTYYVADFTGKFGDLTKVDDLTYELSISEINYSNEPEKTEIKDGMRYIYSTAYGLDPGKTFRVHLEGKAVSELNEEVQSWIMWGNDNSETLVRPIIENVEEQVAFYSYERPSAYEEASLEFSTYQESVKYFMENIGNAETVADMAKEAETAYKVADEGLNRIWNILKYGVDEDKYQKILEEQRQWIKDKDARFEETYAQDGSQSVVDAYAKAANMTIERCEVLVSYLK